MRVVYTEQLSFEQTPIEEVEIDPGSRDDIPAALKGIQHLYCNVPLRERVFTLLEEHILDRVDRADEQEQAAAARVNPALGRPGMHLWIVLVPALLKQALHCDFDRLAELASKHIDVRRIMGLSGPFCDRQFSHRSVIRNVSLVTPALLRALNQLVVTEGQRLAGFESDEPLQARADSFVVETNVHYPTDTSLLWDALRCLLRLLGVSCQKLEVSGWRQSGHWLGKVRKLFNRVRSARQRRGKPGRRRVKLYLRVARLLVKRAEQTLPRLEAKPGTQAVRAEVERLLGHARRQIDQIDRRVLQGETIPHAEKVFSIFEEHTRWCSKGKLGKAVELGVPVAVVESRQQYVLHWQVLWSEQDVDVACSLVQETQAMYPQLSACSFDKGFHSPGNREGLDELLEVNALPKKGRLTKADREREGEPEFRAARQAHPAVESAINNLEQRGLDRVLSRGADGFERMVGLAVVAANLHRIGLVLQRRERAKLKARRAKRRRQLRRMAA